MHGANALECVGNLESLPEQKQTRIKSHQAVSRNYDVIKSGKRRMNKHSLPQWESITTSICFVKNEAVKSLSNQKSTQLHWSAGGEMIVSLSRYWVRHYYRVQTRKKCRVATRLRWRRVLLSRRQMKIRRSCVSESQGVARSGNTKLSLHRVRRGCFAGYALVCRNHVLRNIRSAHGWSYMRVQISPQSSRW